MKKILIIEDDWTFQAVMSVFLCENGYDVEGADNGRIGIKKALCTRPDLILMDYNLGDMKGHEAAFWLEYMNRTRHIPVILLSGATGSAEVLAAIKKYSSFKGILSKGQPLGDILKKVNETLAVK